MEYNTGNLSMFSNMWSQGIFLIGMFGLVFIQTYRYDGQCAVCLEKGCKTGVLMIIPDNHSKPWKKGNEEIPKCFLGNLKPDAPCALSNGSLVLWAEQPLHFEGKDNSDEWKVFRSNNMPCADLDLRSGLTTPSGTQHMDQTNPTANTMTTAAPTMPPWKIAVVACGSVVAGLVITGVFAIVIYRNWNSQFLTLYKPVHRFTSSAKV